MANTQVDVEFGYERFKIAQMTFTVSRSCEVTRFDRSQGILVIVCRYNNVSIQLFCFWSMN